MRFFVGEYVCGGGFGQHKLETIPRSLCLEGAAMLQAVTNDLIGLGEVSVPVDKRFPLELSDEVCCTAVDAFEPLWPQWIAAAQNCDAAIVIAPEQDGILTRAVAMLRASGIDVCMCSGDFLRIASDKWATAKLFAKHQVPHPRTYLGSALPDTIEDAPRWVVKPRDGAGTDQIQTFKSLDRAKASLTDRLILQAWIDGDPVSIAVIAQGGLTIALPAVSQQIDPEYCCYSGGSGPLPTDYQRRATALASSALSVMPPRAHGFVGLDLVLAPDPDQDAVIEINARLTTSYVGLRKMTTTNLAARLLAQDQSPVRCEVPEHSIRWTSDGHVWINDEPVLEK